MGCCGGLKHFFDHFFRVDKFDFCGGFSYLLLGMVAGYIYRHVPIRVECNFWTNFILDPYKVSYAHIALIVIMIHAFNGFGKYIYLPSMSLKNKKFYKREFTGITDTFAFLNIVYPIPLFVLTLYYNYGWDYGLTGLHLVYPLIPVIPYLLNGHKSRDLMDMCQVITGLSTTAIGALNKNYYAVGAYLVQAFAYYFNAVRGHQYKALSSVAYHNGAMTMAAWLMYLALLQSCVDSGGTIDCCRVKQILESNNYCTEPDYYNVCD